MDRFIYAVPSGAQAVSVYGSDQSYQTEVLAALLLLIAGVLVVAFMWIRAAGKARQRKLEVIERALATDGLDVDSRRRLVDELTKPVGLAALLAGCGRYAVMAGWIGMFLGAGVVAMGDDEGIMIALISFGVVTVPFALRELDARQRPSRRSPIQSS